MNVVWGILAGLAALSIIVALFGSFFIEARRKMMGRSSNDAPERLYDGVANSVETVMSPLRELLGPPFGGAVGVMLFGAAAIALFPDLQYEDEFSYSLFAVAAGVFFGLLLRNVPDVAQLSGRFIRFCAIVARWVFCAAGIAAAWGALVVFRFLIPAIALWAFPQEEEIAIKWDDCRKVRQLDDRPALDVFKTYSCAYDRALTDNHIVSGQCVYVQGPVLGSGCEEAKVYPVRERPLKNGKGKH